MKDYAREDAGASIIMASSVDDKYPPENVLDGTESSFWMTTGMFPQEFVVAFAKPIQVSQIVVMMLNVKKLSVERCDMDRPASFEKVFETELQSREGRLQTERHQVNTKAKYLRFTLHGGYADFAAVNRVSVVGQALDGNDDTSAYQHQQQQRAPPPPVHQQQQQPPQQQQRHQREQEEEEEPVDLDDDDEGFGPLGGGGGPRGKSGVSGGGGRDDDGSDFPFPLSPKH